MLEEDVGEGVLEPELRELFEGDGGDGDREGGDSGLDREELVVGISSGLITG